MSEKTIGANSPKVTLDAIKASKSELERLLEVFENIEDKLDPAPAPKPDTVNPNVFRMRNSLRDELRKVDDAITSLDDATIWLRNRVRALQEKICDGRNKSAWGVILKDAAEINQYNFEAIRQAWTNYYQYALFIEKLVTFANTDCLPDEA